MPSFAELKSKAAGITSAGVEKIHHVRDRNTSVPMARTNWDPYSGNPPPPPPPPRIAVNSSTKPLPPFLPPPSRLSAPSVGASSNRTNSTSLPPPLPSRSSSSPSAPPLPGRTVQAAPPRPALQTKPSSVVAPPTSIGAPPPVYRSSRPDLQTVSVAPIEPEIDWANLSPQDKEFFFSWLDEFFADFKSRMAHKSSSGANPARHLGSPPTSPPIISANKLTSGIQSQVRKVIPAGCEPTSQSFAPLSYPPATQFGSAALDLAHYYSPTTVWVDAWYSSDNSVPPPLIGGNNHMHIMSWVRTGYHKAINIGVLFSDLSVFWGTVEFVTTNPKDPKTTKRSARYLPCPEALPQQILIEAHETYGDTIALFAESYLNTGQVCARGECWDLANEGLKSCANFDYIPKPVPSTRCTHGHLIYEARAHDHGKKMEGRWRGGDDRIRRGDIIQWKKARLGAKNGGYFTMGDPDHTSIVSSDVVPKGSPIDGESFSPANVGIVSVVEQSPGKLPQREDYDLRCFEEGELWVYRPIGMGVYLGITELSAEAPVNHKRLERLS